MVLERNHLQRGNAKIQAAIVLLIVAAIGFAALRIIPIYVRAYEYRDFMRSQAKFAGVERRTHEEIRASVYNKAQELGLPVDRDQIRVTGSPGGVNIKSSFSVPVDLMFFQPSLTFNFEADTRTAI